MSSRWGRASFRKIDGYFLPTEEESEGEDEENEAEDDDDFPDISDVDFNGSYTKSQPLKYITGNCFLHYR